MYFFYFDLSLDIDYKWVLCRQSINRDSAFASFVLSSVFLSLYCSLFRKLLPVSMKPINKFYSIFNGVFTFSKLTPRNQKIKKKYYV